MFYGGVPESLVKDQKLMGVTGSSLQGANSFFIGNASPELLNHGSNHHLMVVDGPLFRDDFIGAEPTEWNPMVVDHHGHGNPAQNQLVTHTHDESYFNYDMRI
jgi:hypothetical protein